MTEGSVVDWEGLDHFLTCEYSPVSEELEVLELTNTESVLRTEREDRYSYASALPVGLGVAERRVGNDIVLSALYIPDLAVLAPLHIHDIARLEVVDDILVLHYRAEFSVESDGPNRVIGRFAIGYWILGIGHREFFGAIPFAESGDITHDSYTLMTLEARYRDLEGDVASSFLSGYRSTMCEEHLAEDLRSEERLRFVLPKVTQHDIARLALEEVRHRLAAEDIALFVEDYIAVRDVLMDVAEGDLSRPLRVAVAVHRESHRRCGSDVRICSVENSKLLSPLRLVVDCEMKCHIVVLLVLFSVV